MTELRPPTLSAEMLLFEVAAICSRHGIPVDTSHPSAALSAATSLLRALGLTPAEPARPPAITAAPDTTAVLAPVRPAAPPRFRMGQHRVIPPLAVVRDE